MSRINTIFNVLLLCAVSTYAFGQTPNCNAPSTFYFTSADYKPTGEIKVGQGRLYPNWGVNADAYIPNNRKTWAIALAHASQLLKNITKTDKITPNFYFATSIKESFCGCDPDIQPLPSGSTYAFKFRSESFGDGCFQLNEPTAYNELNFLMPQRIPYGKYPTLARGKSFETAALVKAFYDVFTIKYWEVTQNLKAHEFFNTAKDPNSAYKLLAVAYYRGLWYPTLETVLKGDRTNALAKTSISSYFANDEDAFDYQKAVSNHVNVLSDNVAALSADLQGISAETGQAANSFNSFFNRSIAWSDIEAYLIAIAPLYPEVNLSNVRTELLSTFTSIAGGKSISFRYQFGKVLDKLMMLLPVDDPSSKIADAYGCYSDVSNTSLLSVRKPAQETTLTTTDGARYQVFPNPANDMITVSIRNPRKLPIEWSISDANGKIVLMEKQATPTEFYFEKQFDISTLPQGIYNLQIRTVGKPINQRIVKM